MKKFYSFLLFILMVGSASAQAAHGINYQAVARNGSGNPIASQTVHVKFDIHWGTPAGSVSMTETHAGIITDQFGLFNLVIGSINSADLDTIDWGKNKHFLEVSVDPDAGGAAPFTSMGITQFVSVPYALYAENTASWTKTGSAVFTGVGNSVGIGVNPPLAPLHVKGGEMLLENIGGAFKTGLHMKNANTYNWFIGRQGGAVDDFSIEDITTGHIRMDIDNFGNFTFNDAHLRSLPGGGTLPVITLPLPGGLATAYTIGNATDIKGTIQTEGTISATSTSKIKLQFGKVYQNPPIVILTLSGASAGTGIEDLNVAVESTTTTDVVIVVKNNTAAAISPPFINYFVIE